MERKEKRELASEARAAGEAENPDLERQAKQLERAVYGEPLVVSGEPSIGTQDTPARTDEVYPFHAGGITKQGGSEPIGHIGPPHLPHVIETGPEREEGQEGS